MQNWREEIQSQGRLCLRRIKERIQPEVAYRPKLLLLVGLRSLEVNGMSFFNGNSYVTGGIGAIKQWEGFGSDYFLPQGTDDGGCYAETCASIGVMMLAERMLQVCQTTFDLLDMKCC